MDATNDSSHTSLDTQIAIERALISYDGAVQRHRKSSKSLHDLLSLHSTIEHYMALLDYSPEAAVQKLKVENRELLQENEYLRAASSSSSSSSSVSFKRR